MACRKIDGSAIAKSTKDEIRNRIKERQITDAFFQPCLKIVQVGDRPDSSGYVRMKLKASEEVGVLSEIIQLCSSIAESELLSIIKKLNEDATVHAILVQLPLPDHINEHVVTSAILEEKDVDGFRASNLGELSKRHGRPRFVPCTPKAVMALLAKYKIDLRGKHAVVLGRSDIVGGPLSALLRNADATVTVCHSHTRNLSHILGLADVVIAAIGKPAFVQGQWLKRGAVVIDVGINHVPDASKKSGSRLVGDVDYDSVVSMASLVTPVPGGVGPMTVAMLLENVVEAATAFYKGIQNTPN